MFRDIPPQTRDLLKKRAPVGAPPAKTQKKKRPTFAELLQRTPPPPLAAGQKRGYTVIKTEKKPSPPATNKRMKNQKPAKRTKNKEEEETTTAAELARSARSGGLDTLSRAELLHLAMDCLTALERIGPSECIPTPWGPTSPRTPTLTTRTYNTTLMHQFDGDGHYPLQQKMALAEETPTSFAENEKPTATTVHHHEPIPETPIKRQSCVFSYKLNTP